MVNKPRPIPSRFLPPDYTVRVGLKAKNVRLRVSVEKGLEIIVPKGFDLERIPAILEKKQRWLEKTLNRIDEQRQYLAPKPFRDVPESILLKAIAQYNLGDNQQALKDLQQAAQFFNVKARQ